MISQLENKLIIKAQYHSLEFIAELTITQVPTFCSAKWRLSSCSYQGLPQISLGFLHFSPALLGKPLIAFVPIQRCIQQFVCLRVHLRFFVTQEQMSF